MSYRNELFADYQLMDKNRMPHSIRYFITHTKYNIKNAYALTRSFWIGIVSMAINNSAFFVIWLLFMRTTGPINGWTSLDVFGMLGVSMCVYGFVNSFFRGVGDLPKLVESGSFDGVLLSPVSLFVKIAVSAFSVSAYADLLQGVLIIFLYGVLSGFGITAWLLFGISLVCAVVVFLCARLLASLVAFFLYDGQIIAGQLFEIFLRPTLYPGALFPNALKVFFMTVVPTLLTSALPIDIVKTKSLFLLVTGVSMTSVWVLITIFVFTRAVRKYESGNFLR